MSDHLERALSLSMSYRLEPVLSWLTPLRRRQILAIGAIYIGIKKPLTKFSQIHTVNHLSDIIGVICAVVMLFVMLGFIYRLAIKFKTLPILIQRHPYLTLHLFFWVFLSIIWLTSPFTGWWRTMLMCMATSLPFLIWRCCYVLQSGQNGKSLNTSFTDHLFYLWPAFGGSNVPTGKGYDYLSRVETKTNEELARSQLSGIKLILLATCWSLVAKLMENSFYGNHSFLAAHGGGIPKLGQLVNMGSGANIGISWISLYCELFYEVLEHAANGHTIVGILRIFGFNVFRNTYKPLLAESIVEFWNRYFYYFKELLSIFFFIPTFMKLGVLKKWPNVRLFVAVFSAAFIGNMYYHIIFQTNRLVSGEIFEIIYSLRSRFFYCFLLSIGIFISMWHAQKRHKQTVSTHWFARNLRIFGVWTFFCLIFIWNVPSGGDFMTRVAFFFHLFGF